MVRILSFGWGIHLSCPVHRAVQFEKFEERVLFGVVIHGLDRDTELREGVFEERVVVEGHQAYWLLVCVCALDFVQEALVVGYTLRHRPPTGFAPVYHELQVVANCGELLFSSGMEIAFCLEILKNSLECLSPKGSQPGNDWLALREMSENRVREDGPVLEELVC